MIIEDGTPRTMPIELKSYAGTTDITTYYGRPNYIWLVNISDRMAIPQISIPTSTREVSRCQIILISDQRWTVNSMQCSRFSSSSFLGHPFNANFFPRITVHNAHSPWTTLKTPHGCFFLWFTRKGKFFVMSQHGIIIEFGGTAKRNGFKRNNRKNTQHPSSDIFSGKAFAFGVISAGWPPSSFFF